MKTYETVLFDWDGCLAQTLEVWLDAFKEVYAEYDVRPSDREIANQFGNWKDGPEIFGIKNPQECMEKIVLLAQLGLNEVQLYPGAKEMLETVGEDKKIGLVSSSKRDILDKGLEYNGIGDLFNVVYAAEDVSNHKPNPEVIFQAVEALGGSINSAILVGDSDKDLGAAKNAEIDSILVHHPGHDIFYNIDYLKKFNPTYVVSSLGELATIL